MRFSHISGDSMAKISFDEFYRDQYGERWEELKAALLSDIEDKTSPDGLESPYFMDRTSIETAFRLPLSEGDIVLDMCAAPGGKTIVLLTRLKGSGKLVSNDRSADRRERMRRAIETTVCDEWRKNSIITGHDSSKWGLYEKDIYDAILLDAPCSSERHVIQSKEHFAAWSPSRPKRLQALQYSMLASAMLALKKGGYLLYSTCSINKGEDEDIIARFMKKHPGEAEEIQIQLENGEKREHGVIVLPDRSGGRGPMYAALLKKI